jgi:hypothetical protein
VFVAFVALLTAWALAVSLAALFLGPRARTLRAGPWRVYRAQMGYRGRRGSTPWL